MLCQPLLTCNCFACPQQLGFVFIEIRGCYPWGGVSVGGQRKSAWQSKNMLRPACVHKSFYFNSLVGICIIVNQQTTEQGIGICTHTADCGCLVSEMITCPLFFVSEDLTSSIMAARPSMALALGQQQVAGLARAATLEQLREKLETGGGEGPERKMARLAEEQQRLMQQAFQHNLLAMASQMPMNLRLGAPTISTRGQCPQSFYSTTALSMSCVHQAGSSVPLSLKIKPNFLHIF